MLITVYADRRSNEVADIAGRLADALANLPAGGDVALVTSANMENAAPGRVAQLPMSDTSSAHEVGVLLRGISQQYTNAVVAISGTPDGRVLTAFDESDRLLIVSDPSVASIRGTQRTLRLCQSLGYGADKTAVVLHDFREDSPLAPADAANALKREIFYTLPGGAGAGESAVSGSVQHAYTRLAQRLVGDS
jgi:Flp pilus assembly CpaE family ATPase